MELLIVVAIIAMLFISVAMIIRTSINRAKTAKVQSDLNRIAKAIYHLEIDTGFFPNKELKDTCGLTGGMVTGAGNEVAISTVNVTFQERLGIFENFSPGPVAGWNGPYMDSVDIDPWGNPYIYDGDYTCVTGVRGCENFLTGTVNDRVIVSHGEDETEYTADDIVLVLCGV